MANIAYVLVLALALFSASSAEDLFDVEEQEWVDYRYREPRDDTTTLAPGTEFNCTGPGLVCESCTKLVLCRQVAGQWIKTPVQTCENKQTCNVDKCSDTPAPGCGNLDFECVSNEGMYPDPASCTKFHYCVPPQGGGAALEHFASACTNDYQYNSKTTYCDTKIVNNKCSTPPVPLCTKPGQTGILVNNPSMYYICLPHSAEPDALYPYLYLCENGKKYNPAQFNCA